MGNGETPHVCGAPHDPHCVGCAYQAGFAAGRQARETDPLAARLRTIAARFDRLALNLDASALDYVTRGNVNEWLSALGGTLDALEAEAKPMPSMIVPST